MRRRLSISFAALLVVGAIALAPTSPAAAWTDTLHEFTGAEKGASVTARLKLKKCQGGKLGTYELKGGIYVTFGDEELLQQIRADVSIRESWRPIRDVDLRFEVPKDFDPDITAAILDAYGRFYESIETRWSPGELEVRHGELTVFGSEILSPGVHKEDFKPKPGC